MPLGLAGVTDTSRSHALVSTALMIWVASLDLCKSPMPPPALESLKFELIRVSRSSGMKGILNEDLTGIALIDRQTIRHLLAITLVEKAPVRAVGSTRQPGNGADRN